VVGNDFYVKASCRDSGIWKVSTCIVSSEDGSMPDNKYTIEYAAKIAGADAAAAAAAAAIVDAADEPRDDMDDQVSVMDSGKVNDDENGGNVPAKTKIVLPHSPYLAKWIVPLIHTTIAETPCASSKTLKNVLCVYGKDFCFARAIINESRLLARKAVFGNANENANYIFALYDELRLGDHSVCLSFATLEQALNKLMLVVLAKEGQRIKTDCNRR